MYYTGFADEASPDIDLQIKATKELGWSNIEARGLYGSNLAFLSDAQFEELCGKLSASGVSINCFGSGIANWAKPITDSPESSYDEFRKAIPRMHKLGIKMVRMMSFAVPAELKPKSWDYFDEVIKRLAVIVKMAEDAGILCVHENCMNWGSLSLEHTLKVLERIKSPNFKLVFDTGNPVFNDDIRGTPPYKKQSSWEYYNAVKEHVVYIHIKDGFDDNGKQVFTFAGEGKGDVRRILKDLFSRGYDGGISIEPHMAYVFHEENKDRKAELCYKNYVEYGQRIMGLVAGIKKELGKK